jgi:hypothetical protein
MHDPSERKNEIENKLAKVYQFYLTGFLMILYLSET